MTLLQPRSPRRGLPLGFYVLICCRAGRQARPRAAFQIPSLLVASRGSTSRWLQQPYPRVPDSRGQPLDLFFPSPPAQKKSLPRNCSSCSPWERWVILCCAITQPRAQGNLPRISPASSPPPFTSSGLRLLLSSWQCSYARCVCHLVHPAEVREIQPRTELNLLRSLEA